MNNTVEVISLQGIIKQGGSHGIITTEFMLYSNNAISLIGEFRERQIIENDTIKIQKYLLIYTESFNKITELLNITGRLK